MDVMERTDGKPVQAVDPGESPSRERRKTLSRWIVCLCEPLVPVKDQLSAESDVVKLIAVHSPYFGVWFSGLLSYLVQSLDATDPWRQLSSHNGEVHHPDGKPFGTWADATDILPPSTLDLRSDPGFAALSAPLSPDAQKLFAAACLGRMQVGVAYESLVDGNSSCTSILAEWIFETTTSALRWAIYRRRIFGGADDAFIPMAAVAWIRWADAISDGSGWDETRAKRMLSDATIPEGTYRLCLEIS